MGNERSASKCSAARDCTKDWKRGVKFTSGKRHRRRTSPVLSNNRFPDPSLLDEIRNEPLVYHWDGETDDDSDIDEVGNIVNVPSRYRNDSSTYSRIATLADHQAFGMRQAAKYPNEWDANSISRNPSQFYEEFFKDHALRKSIRRKGHRLVAENNNEITRDPLVTSEHRSYAIRSDLERQVGSILDQIFKLFESGYVLSDQEMVQYLSERLIRGINSTKHLFVSSRCRDCHKAQGQVEISLDERKARFRFDVAHSMRILRTEFLRAEDRLAFRLLSRTVLRTNECDPRNPFQLPYTRDELRRISKLPVIERKRFNHQLEAFTKNTSLPDPRVRKPELKTFAPILVSNLTNDRRNSIVDSRKRTLLEIAKLVLQRFESRQPRLFSRYGKR